MVLVRRPRHIPRKSNLQGYLPPAAAISPWQQQCLSPAAPACQWRRGRGWNVIGSTYSSMNNVLGDILADDPPKTRVTAIHHRICRYHPMADAGLHFTPLPKLITIPESFTTIQ